LPSGHRRSLLGHPVPAEELGPPHGRLTGPHRAGPRRGYRVPHARATTGEGAPYTPGTTVLTRTTATNGPAPAASRRPVPFPRQPSHRRGCSLTRQTRIHTKFARPIFPSPVATRMERAALGLSPRASHPADQEPTTHAEVRTGHRARTWNYRSTQLTSVNLQSSSSLNTCDLASHATKGVVPCAGRRTPG
jgi:hypothetical protein